MQCKLPSNLFRNRSMLIVMENLGKRKTLAIYSYSTWIIHFWNHPTLKKVPSIFVILIKYYICKAKTKKQQQQNEFYIVLTQSKCILFSNLS